MSIISRFRDRRLDNVNNNYYYCTRQEKVPFHFWIERDGRLLYLSSTWLLSDLLCPSLSLLCFSIKRYNFPKEAQSKETHLPQLLSVVSIFCCCQLFFFDKNNTIRTVLFRRFNWYLPTEETYFSAGDLAKIESWLDRVTLPTASLEFPLPWQFSFALLPVEKTSKKADQENQAIKAKWQKNVESHFLFSFFFSPVLF